MIASACSTPKSWHHPEIAPEVCGNSEFKKNIRVTALASAREKFCRWPCFSLCLSLCLSLAKTVKNRHAASISVYNNRLSATWTARWHQNYKQLPSHRRHCFRYFLRISRGARTAGTSKVFWSVPRCRCHDPCIGNDDQLRFILQRQQADTTEIRFMTIVSCNK